MVMPSCCFGVPILDMETALWLKSANHHANKAESADPVTALITQMRVPIKKK